MADMFESNPHEFEDAISGWIMYVIGAIAIYCITNSTYMIAYVLVRFPRLPVAKLLHG